MIPSTNKNLRYCLQFLRNGGERLRAIRLAKDVLGLTLPESIKFVDDLKERAPLDSNRELIVGQFCQCCNYTWDAKTTFCPGCGTVKLTAVKYNRKL